MSSKNLYRIEVIEDCGEKTMYHVIADDHSEAINTVKQYRGGSLGHGLIFFELLASEVMAGVSQLIR